MPRVFRVMYAMVEGFRRGVDLLGTFRPRLYGSGWGVVVGCRHHFVSLSAFSSLTMEISKPLFSPFCL